MPRKAAVDPDILVQAIIDNKNTIYNHSTKKFYGNTHSCWNHIAEQLNYQISAKNIYTIVIMNRYNVQSKLGFEYHQVQDKCDNSVLETSFSDSSVKNNEVETDKKEFKITLSIEEWKKLYKTQEYDRKDRKNSNRNYNILLPYEWTSLIHSHFYEQTRISCPITYKRCKIYPNGTVYMDINGLCKFCNSIFSAVMEYPPEPESRVILECVYSGNFKCCTSTRKRRLRGERREEFLSKLTKQNMSASYIQKLEAKNIMNYGDEEPAHLPSLNALRLLKFKDSKMNKLHEDSLLSVILLKQVAPYSQIIRDIGYDRFFVHYWGASELNNYRLYCKTTIAPKISIDATGGLVQKFNLINQRKTKTIFLYEIAVHGDGYQFSAGHMLSERHDNNAIAYWLSEWVRNDIPSPKIVVTDHSLALMIAVVKTFTQYTSLHKYLAVCSALLYNKSDTDLPNCMLRIDFNHTVHLISSWPEIKYTTKRIKNFYMRAICLIICSTDFEDIKFLLKCIFRVSLNEEDGLNADGLPTICEEAKNNLKKRISVHGLKDDVFPEINEDEEKDDDSYKENDVIGLSEESTENTSTYNEILDLYRNCLAEVHNECNRGDHDNMQCNPAIAKKLVVFCKHLTVWSAVMLPFFNYSNITESSASSESLFNDLKNRIFQHKKIPTSLDNFLKIHIDSIIGNMNILGAKLIHTTSQKHKEEEYAVENWRGEVTKNNKSNYSHPDPTVLYYNDASKTKSSVIGMLKNGSTVSLKSVGIQGNNYTLTNTCTFDSIFQILCTASADSLHYRDFIEENSHLPLFEMILNAVRDGVNVQTYKKRAKILIDLFEDSLQNTPLKSHFQLNTECTAYFLFKKLFLKYPSIKENYVCSNCKKMTMIENNSVQITLSIENFVVLSELVNEFINRETFCCGTSTSKTDKTVMIEKHIVIETLAPSSSERLKDSNFEITMKLSSIPRQINVNNNMYTLRGAIHFQPPVTQEISAIGHYIAYCWREHSQKWEEYNDLKDRPHISKSSTNINCQFVIYTL